MMERNQIEQESFDFLKELSDSIDESRHTPIVLDVYGEAVDMIIARDARIRAEALKEAAERAEVYMVNIRAKDIEFDYDDLRATIMGDVKES